MWKLEALYVLVGSYSEVANADGGQQMTAVTGSSLASWGVVWKWQETGTFSCGLEF